MRGLDFDWILANNEDTEGSRENNITGSWKGYQNLSGSSTCLWTPTVGQEEPYLLSPRLSLCPPFTRAGETGHLTVVPQAVTFLSLRCSWAPSSLSPNPA